MAMMMFPDKKRAATMIISSMKPDFVERIEDKGNFPDRTEREDDYSTALDDAGRKVLAAIERKDAKDLASYMKELIYLCQDDHESNYSED